MPDTLVQSLSDKKPVLILDADEVLFRFIEGLEAFLKHCGMTMRFDSYGLDGNIFHSNDNSPVSSDRITQVIHDFFDNNGAGLTPAPHASDCLARLSEDWQITILTNIPEEFKQQRIQNLRNHNMDFPVIANSGGKGRTVQKLLSATQKPTVFIDDMPVQHQSVAKHAPSCHRIHHISDPRIAALIAKADHAHIRLDCWMDIESHLNHLYTHHK